MLTSELKYEYKPTSSPVYLFTIRENGKRPDEVGYQGATIGFVKLHIGFVKIFLQNYGIILKNENIIPNS